MNQYRAWSPYSIINYDDDIGGTWGAPGAANGVLMQDGNITAGFNALNQPMYIWSGTSGWIHFGYDPLGRCVKRWNDSGAATYLFYDGWNLIQEGPQASNPSRLYIHGARVDELVAQITPANKALRYFHYDANGNCILQTDGSGALLEQYSYDAFGYPYFHDRWGTNVGSSPSGNRFLFTGREWLSDLKLYDYRHRLYQPELGRFLQPDPKHFAAGDYNLYRYCRNDPVNRSDPDGLYARGNGWTDKQWEKFDRAQHDIASKIEKAAAKMDIKLFEKVFGKGSATPQNLLKVSQTMQKMAAALRDDGSKGYVAHATHDWAIHARGLHRDTLGHTKVHGNQIHINVDHSRFASPSSLRWTTGHESGHNQGLLDVPVDGMSAYKHNSAAYNGLTPAQALKNADSYIDFANQ